MPFIYEASVESESGGETRVFRHLYQARRFIQENDVGGYYRIHKVEITKPSIDLVIDIINSCGGSYAIGRARVEGRDDQ